MLPTGNIRSAFGALFQGQQADVGITDIDLQVTYNRDRLDT